MLANLESMSKLRMETVILFLVVGKQMKETKKKIIINFVRLC